MIPAASSLSPRWIRTVPWIALLAALGWSAVIRAPLIVNADVHLDSDLAVDGLTLSEAIQGHWRWHYPGTPYMGTGSVLLSWVPAKLWGVSPATLVSGGTLAYLLLVGGVFATTWKGFGPRVAGWSLVPLAFASTGTIWLTGRITGGHMLAAAWSAWAWWLLMHFASKPSPARGFALGVFCGLGVYLDSLFLMTLLGLVPSGMAAVIVTRGDAWRASRALACGLCLVAGFAIGYAPRPIGRWMEPHDAYNEQFAWSLDSAVLTEHARILFLDCLPRLIAGHRLPGLEADPDPALLGQAAPIQKTSGRASSISLVAALLTPLAVGLFVASFGFLGRRAGKSAMAFGLLISTAAILSAFVVNRNIFNSDNYRYLVLLLIPWALGFGLAAEAVGGWSRRGLAVVIATAVAIGGLFTLDAAAWYRRLGWIDDRWAVVHRPLDDPALRWLGEHPEVVDFAAGYWDAYRLAFLSRRPLRGTPHPIYPNRFPEWSKDLPGGRSETLIARPTAEDQAFLRRAIGDGGRILFRERGTTIASWPIAKQPDRP
ncbi:hypothetical protein [Paludisphaera borealis]|uniref:Glycosyltransferase RgtA/B/C/D-like domain-containing protein n=1 Tax=Paludisphaera borealis TaxID=1387353 RepID=A0A1U7CWM1_9BACT|nr:hypothetical protein [Paludisphaera borealis]APW63321.1 hypothetical protein BSF38_04885 [Paludisphaera borealis]